MFKKLFKKKSQYILFVVFVIFLLGCKTTNSITKKSFDPQAPVEAEYLIAQNLETKSSTVVSDNNEKTKYVFFRLYNPIYKNPFYIANILKFGIGLTRIKGNPDVSHASINFDLEDDFYGLSLGGEYQLKIEECLDTTSNIYMKNCDPTKSEQVTYALKVTPEEYEKTKHFIEVYADSPDLKYVPFLNFKFALFCLDRKFFTTKKHKQFGYLKYPKKNKNKIVDIEDKSTLENDFVCSSFIGYALYNTVDDIQYFFDERNIKYDYLNVPDISQIPEVIPLFYSTWDNYMEAAESFVKEYPEFAEYLNLENKTEISTD